MKAKLNKNAETEKTNNDQKNMITFETLSSEIKTNFISKIEKLKSEVGNLVITDATGLNQATEFLNRIKKASDTIEEKRDSFVRPFNTEVKRINGEFKFVSNPLNDLESMIKNEMSRYYKAKKQKADLEAQKLREIEAAKIAKLEKELKSKNALKVSAAENKIESIQTETASALINSRPETKIFASSGSAQFKEVWKWELEDLSLLSDVYKIANSPVINAAVKSGNHNIPGLRIYKEISVSGRSN